MATYMHGSLPMVVIVEPFALHALQTVNFKNNSVQFAQKYALMSSVLRSEQFP